jgi:hypothetical protein
MAGWRTWWNRYRNYRAAQTLVQDVLNFLGWKQTFWAAVTAGLVYVAARLRRLAGVEQFVLALAAFALVLLVLLLLERVIARSHARTQPNPEITARWLFRQGASYTERTGFRLMLQNTGQAVAVNISALPLEFKIPASFIAHVKAETERMVAQSGAEIVGDINDYTPTVWRVTFGLIDKIVVNSGEHELEYHISDIGPLQQDIADILPHFIGWDAKFRFPLATAFSDTIDPDIIWHSHYESEFTYRPNKKRQRLTARFLGFSAAGADGKCSCCLSNDGSS